MKNITFIFIILFFVQPCFAQPSNENCGQALVLQNVSNYCSADKEFSTQNATDGDIWFQFTAIAFDVNISVSGNTDGSGNIGGTMQNPGAALFSSCGAAQIVTSQISSDNVTSIYKGGLIIGTVYYIRTSGAVSGSFKLCVNNYNPIVKPGQDCSSASALCSKETFTQTNVSGGGLNSDEANGTCLSAFGVNSEQNSAWYKWTAADNGTLTFVLTPTANDDIDWVLYDLGTMDNCAAISPATAIRCNAGRGVDCLGPGQKRYTKTGLDLTSRDLSENGGCFEGQDGFVRFVDMQQGHIYALLVNNFDRGNNGFTVEFGGTGQFLGPQARIELQQNNACTPEQDFTFTSLSDNYNRLKWTFGQGASIDSTNTAGPITVNYSTPGIKTVVLQAFGDKGCSVVSTKTFAVSTKPDPPTISVNQDLFCLKETITLSTAEIAGATYNWSGPNGFISGQRTTMIPVFDYTAAGVYSLSITVNGCTSDPSSITIPPINPTPEINLEIADVNPCSKELSYNITYSGSNYDEIKADFGQGAIVNSGSGTGPYNITYSSPGTRSVVINASNSSGCTVTVSKIIDVPVIPERPIITLNKTRFCINDTIKLSTAAKPNTSYIWSGPNNFQATGPSINILVNNTNLTGGYTLIATSGNCSSEAATTVVSEIIKVPVAAFTSDPKIPARLTAPATVQFINNSTDADAYVWDFGDGATSTEKNPVHEYSAFGEFDVILTATKSQACSATVIQGKLFISADNKIFIPNTFTPNADRVNDEFVVSISNIESYQIQIFNRYGTPIFRASDIFDNWKGLHDNKSLPVGTYYYIIDAVSLSGELIKKSGSISIIK